MGCFFVFPPLIYYRFAYKRLNIKTSGRHLSSCNKISITLKCIARQSKSMPSADGTHIRLKWTCSKIPEIEQGLIRSTQASIRKLRRPLTLLKFIQTAGVAEGTSGSRLPAAPTLHPSSWITLMEAKLYITISLKIEKNVLIQQSAKMLHRCTYSSTFHIINSCHMLLPVHSLQRGTHSNHQTTLLPECTTAYFST